MKLYKILKNNGFCCNGGRGEWSLPKDEQPGDWMPAILGDLDPCRRGYHLCRPEDILDWLSDEIYEAEGKGDMIECKNKIVFREARLIKKLDSWNQKSARLFSKDCVEHILYTFNARKITNNYSRPPIQAIQQAIRDFMSKKISERDMDIAWDTTQNAPRDIIGDSVWEADWKTTWNNPEAWLKERQWQRRRLVFYLFPKET